MRSALMLMAAVVLAIPPARGEDLPPDVVRLSLERYEKLMRAAQRKEGPQVTWGRGNVSVTLPGESEPFLAVDLSCAVHAVGAGDPEVVVLPADVVIEEITINGNAATLTRRDGAHVVILERTGQSYTVSVRYLVPARPGTAGRVALVPVPPMPGSTLRIQDAGDAEVEIWPMGKVTRDGSALSATLPSTLAVALRFDDGTTGHQVRRVDYTLEVAKERDGGATVQARLEVHVAAASAKVQLGPESMALVDVREKDEPLVTRVREGWHEVLLSGTGRHVVTASFRLPVARTKGQPLVVLQTSRVPITHVTATVPGKQKVTMEPDIPLETTVAGEKDAELTTAKGYLPPTDELTIRWTESRPIEEKKLVRINSETYQIVSIQEGVMRSKVHVRYSILRGTVKELPVQVPKGVVLYKVAGDAIEDWRAAAEDPRRVIVYLGREREGTYDLTLELETAIPKKEGEKLEIPVVRPLGPSEETGRETGVVALFDGEKVGFGPAVQTSYTAVGQDALPVWITKDLKQTVSQAFKHIGEPGAISATIAAVQAKEVLYDARVSALYMVKEGAIGANATVQVDIKSGRSDRLVLSFPKDVTILMVTAPSLSKKGPVDLPELKDRQGYELKFGQKLDGTIEAHLEFELVPKGGLTNLALPDIRVIGAEVEEGAFGITAETGMEVTEARVDKLRKVDIAELPGSVVKRRVGTQEILVGYTYAHTPWLLQLDIKRHETVKTLTAAVRAAWLETTVFEDGHVVTRAVFQVKNEDRQFLRVRLPDEAKVWAVAVDGAPAKAVMDEAGAVAIKLTKGSTMPVEVVYEQAVEPLGWVGSLDFLAPKADVLVTDLQWLVRVPLDYAIRGVDTGMKDAEADDYRPPEYAASQNLPVAMPPEGDVQALLFTLPVNNAAEDAPKVAISYVVRPGTGLGVALWIAAIVLLILGVFRRTLGKGGAWLCIVLGLVAGILKALGFGVDTLEMVVLAVLLVAAALSGVLLLTARKRREEKTR